jgi:hypothetical protein
MESKTLNKKGFLIVPLLFFCMLSTVIHADDTGKVITNQCRQNLKMLNEGTRKFLQESDSAIPIWGKYETIKSSLIDYNYYPKDPVPPTRDCHYYLVSTSRDDFQWYCDLHGVLEGEKTITFRYHEHQLMAKTSSRYANIPKYADHVKDLLRWTEYNPTPVEKLKFYYNMNPMTTVIGLVGGFLLLLFIYRNVN